MIKFFKKISLLLLSWTCIYLFLKYIISFHGHYGLTGLVQIIFEALISVVCILTAVWVFAAVFFSKKFVLKKESLE